MHIICISYKYQNVYIVYYIAYPPPPSPHHDGGVRGTTSLARAGEKNSPVPASDDMERPNAAAMTFESLGGGCKIGKFMKQIKAQINSIG